MCERVSVYVCDTVQVWRPKDNIQEPVLSFYCVTQILVLVDTDLLIEQPCQPKKWDFTVN